MKTTIKICLWILAFVPLVVDFKVFFPYTSGKNLLIESALVLAGILIIINFFISRGFREEIIDKVVKYVKNPLVLSVTAFVLINIISTIFAVDKYAAFWGELSRAEGLAGMIFFFAFFVFGLLSFERKDWLWFFKLSLLASLILLGKEFFEYFGQHIDRPGSFTGNPTFLAGYLLFSLASAGVVFAEEKNKFWRFLSPLIIILAVLGIFLAQTRGTILGLGIGFIMVLIYCAFKGKEVVYKKINLQKVSIGLICLGIIFSGTFFFTRKAEVWQKVPGLARVAQINLKQDSTASRLYIYRAGLRSVNPITNGWGKILVGWGPDNFINANSQYYDANQYIVEARWFDRAHNKIIDALVMNGIFGLLAYLAIWLFFFASLKRNRESWLVSPKSDVGGFSLTNLALLFFGISYLIHLMFVFDEISTSIPFFSILAFGAYLSLGNVLEEPQKDQISTEIREILTTGFFLVILTVFLIFVYFKSTLPSYLQMRNYTSLVQNIFTENFETEIVSVFKPFTLAQMNIRKNFLDFSSKLYNNDRNKNNLKLFQLSLIEGDEYVSIRSQDIVFLSFLADTYSGAWNITKDSDYLKRGEVYFRKIIRYFPNRPDMNRGLAANLFYQKMYEESFICFEKTFDLSPGLFSWNQEITEKIYLIFLRFFYNKKDEVNFIKVINRLKENNYTDLASLSKIIDYLHKYNTWPKVNFE